MSIHRNIIRLTLVTLSLSLSLAVLASKPPAQPKEGFGVFLVVLSQTAAGAAADDGKLDIAAYGGTLFEERDNILVVTLPLEAWPRVESHSRVSYVQRVWMGEPREQWEAQRRTERRPRAATQSMESLPEAAAWDSATYAYDGSGNITAIGDDHYSYDTAGRIAQASVDGVPEQYGYDAFGNLTSKRTNGNPSPIPPIDPSSNRLIGYPYDEAGNVTSLPGGGGTWEHASSYTYDALGMPVLVQGHTERSPHRMIYTADDERLALMNIGNDAQIWVRGFDGKVLREYRGNLLAGYWTWKQDYVWAAGQLVSAEREDANGGRLHFHLDHLGSVRLITKRDTTRLSSHGFFPFGVERTDSTSEVRNFDIENNRVEPMKFTGHERDFYGFRNVDGTDYLDYMHARYYDANMGRFLSVDPGHDWDLHQPQSWNLYAYVRNNPVNATDPTGRNIYKTTWRILKYIGQEGKLIAHIAENSKNKALKRITGALDSIDTRGGAKRVLVAENPEARDAVTRQLGDSGKIRGPEKSGVYPEHVQAADGKYADVHVQTVDDMKAAGFGKGLLSIVAATSMAAGASQNATAGEIVSAAIWDAAKAIDPLFVTDIIEHATGLDEYEEERMRDIPPE